MSAINIHKVSELIKLIDEIAAKNRQTIERINAKLQKSVLTYNYIVEFSRDSKTLNPKFLVQQQQKHVSTKSLIDQWRNDRIKLSIIPDIFNDKINFDCFTYSNISRLNKAMLRVVHKYELFGETEKAYEEVNKFYNNFEHLQTLLAEIEKIFNEPESQLSHLNERFDNITNELNYLKERFGSNIQYQYNL